MITLVLSLLLFFTGVLLPICSAKVYGSNKPVVIVLDPGHGGFGENNLGAQYNGFSEKDLTLKLANAVKANLDQYDNVTVLLTRTTDQNMNLEDRAIFAKEHGADFLFSIHLNASSEHLFYGSEVWTSFRDGYYQKGATVGQLISEEWNQLGLYQKGVKTRIGKQGADYYGIIRQSVARGVPCVILEHAYLDNDVDVSLLKTSSFVDQLAAADATAIAKYFHLSSASKGVDYSTFQYRGAKRPSGNLYQDESGPEVCSIDVLATDPSNGNVLVELTTKDSYSSVIYFSYSYDGGKTFSPLQMWDRTQNTQSFNVKVPSGTVNPTIVVRSYNNYEKGSESNAVTVEQTFNY